MDHLFEKSGKHLECRWCNIRSHWEGAKHTCQGGQNAGRFGEKGKAAKDKYRERKKTEALRRKVQLA